MNGNNYKPIPSIFNEIDAAHRKELECRWVECQKCHKNECYLSSVVLAGSIIEGVLLWAISKNSKEAQKLKIYPKMKNGLCVKTEKLKLQPNVRYLKRNWVAKPRDL